MSSKKTKVKAKGKVKPKKTRGAKASAGKSARPQKKAAAPKSRTAARPVGAAKAKSLASKRSKARPKVTAVKPAAKTAPGARPSPAKTKAPAPPAAGKTASAPAAPARARSGSRRSRRSTFIRRGPNGEILAPGDLLLPGGPRGSEEIQYLFRGCMAAERPVTEEAVNEVLQKRGVPEGPGERDELMRAIEWARARFEEGDVEPIIPVRSNVRRTFQGVVERARQRRREIGAFLRGLDMGHTETSHMDAHGEASLQSLMEWAARLENLVENLTETDESNQGHYVQFHRVLDQLESTTEALIIDVEQTLRRLRDRLRS